MLANRPPLHIPNPKPFVARLERHPVNKLHQTGDRLAPAQVRNVHSLDPARRLCQLQHLLEARHALLRINRKDLRLDVRIQFAALIERFEQMDLVAQPGGLFELERLGRRFHLVPHLPKQSFFAPLKKLLQSANILAILFLGDPPIARRVHWWIVASRQGRNHRQRSSPSSMSSEQVRNRKIFCKTWIAPRRLLALANGP